MNIAATQTVYEARCQSGDNKPSEDWRRGRGAALFGRILVSHRSSQGLPAQGVWWCLLRNVSENMFADQKSWFTSKFRGRDKPQELGA